ncbi:MAG: hypothetical protein ACTSX6_10550 [Candidatus Heimdallarchaeaceae archaeon]
MGRKRLEESIRLLDVALKDLKELQEIIIEVIEEMTDELEAKI